jgi:hypothetical protein
MKLEEDRPVEGDFILTKDCSFFDVKGLIHPPNQIIAFIRYSISKKGERKRNGAAYTKVYSFSERYSLLMKKSPQYLVYDPVFDETLCEVPTCDVKKVYRPVEKLRELQRSRVPDQLESKALQFTGLLKKTASVPDDSIGISGSIMIGLHAAGSDIDLIVYGSKNCRRVYTVLKGMFKNDEGCIRPYSREELRTLFDFRSKDTASDFESFLRTESRKVMQGKFMQTDYFIRFVKNSDEIDEHYGDIQYKNNGIAEIKATIVDDSEAIFTPCTYKIDNVHVLKGSQGGQIAEIASFRGRFCEQAKVGETIIASGKVERVTDKRHGCEYFRLLLGNKPSDFMVLAQVKPRG